MTVIFDGRAHDAGGGLRVAVRFARRSGRDAADDDVAAVVARHPEPSSLSVVTSDGALADRVRAAGGQVVGAGAFLRRLDDAEIADACCRVTAWLSPRRPRCSPADRRRDRIGPTLGSGRCS